MRDRPIRWLASRCVFPVTLGTSMAAVMWATANDVQWLPYVALATVVGIVVGMERFIPFLDSWNEDHGDQRTDVMHLLVSNLAAPRVYQMIFVFLCAPLAVEIASWLGVRLWPVAWPAWLQLTLALVVAEFGQYWAHRVAHERASLWRLHAVHHSPLRLYWLNAGRDHPLGVLLLFSTELVPLLLLGVPEEVLLHFAMFTAVHGLFQHANIDVRLGPLNWVFSMAELHRWHHSAIVAEANHNYGANLIVWDVVFGTRLSPPAPSPGEVGIGAFTAFPGGYVAQLAVPFKSVRWWQTGGEP